MQPTHRGFGIADRLLWEFGRHAAKCMSLWPEKGKFRPVAFLPFRSTIAGWKAPQEFSARAARLLVEAKTIR
jgi:hypothetical protein